MASTTTTAKSAANRVAAAARAAVDAEPTVEDLSAQMETLRADMAQIVETMGALSRAKTGEAAEALAETAAELRRRGEEQLAAAREKGSEALESATGYVRSHPAESLAVAAGLGFVVGLLLRRR